MKVFNAFALIRLCVIEIFYVHLHRKKYNIM